MADEQLVYPQAFIAQGNGDLLQVTNFTLSFTNGAKLKHTLRRKGAGHTLGNPETTVTYDAEIDEDGPERNYWRDAQRGTIRQLRAKIPGGRTTLTVNGVYSQVDLDGPLDDATKVKCTFIGKLEDVTT
jgi:hypothetical protein